MPFIVFEGGEGSGKDTQIDLLKKRLDPERTVFTREPGGTPIGEKIRELVLSKEYDMEQETELLLFMASRAEHLIKVIRPAIKAGKLVVCNRFALSTIAYQIYGRERQHHLPFLQGISAGFSADMAIAHCILLDIEPIVGIERVKGRRDGMTRFDAERLAFHEKVRQGYLKHYNDNGRGVRIDAGPSIEHVAGQIADQMKLWGL